ncbi:unnamed protein product [Mytilus edulis]|uniref:DZIP3-like HEPN domain-containing protein n=1 Tax=Mytilus edulis TaxID=6550 RepID=A0A8S3Q0F2_MYTED|nr:unnamed protein product [Mytilus edulis]
MICLIRNLTSISPPINGFDTLPLPGEITPGSDLARIKCYRNKLAHHDSNKIDTAFSNTAWREISDFDVDGICLGRLFERKIRLMASIKSPTKLSSSMIEEILTIIAWSFSDDISATNFKYQYNVQKKDYVLHIQISGDLINEQSYEKGLNIEKQIGKAQWLIRVSPRNGFTFQVNVVGVTKEQGVVTQLSEATVKNKLNQFKVNQNDSFEKKLCANSIIECEISNDVENPRTVITEFACVDFIEQQPILLSTNINMNVITYTGMGISVIALTASLFVYRRLGMHRSIPGSNVENLTIALLISDIIFMLGIGANDLSLVCYSVGVALHYLWLVVFSFKCIALIHMCHSFTKLSLISGDIEVGIFSKRPFFTLLGLLLPCLFVVPAVLIDFLEVDGVSINYSGSICFPTGYPAETVSPGAGDKSKLERKITFPRQSDVDVRSQTPSNRSYVNANVYHPLWMYTPAHLQLPSGYLTDRRIFRMYNQMALNLPLVQGDSGTHLHC